MSALPALDTAALGRTMIYVGDCRETLQRLPAQSVHCVVTSPPYFGLRSYSTPPQVWGGDDTCAHSWGRIERGAWANEVSGPSENVGKNGATRSRPKEAGCYCVKCGAWRGDLGLEPTVDMFIDHLVDVFREVWRVLRDDGTCFLNIADSYCGGGNGPQRGINHRPDETTPGGGKGKKQSKAKRYRLRTGLTDEQLAYVLQELAAARKVSKVSPPNVSLGVDEAITTLAGGE